MTGTMVKQGILRWSVLLSSLVLCSAVLSLLSFGYYEAHRVKTMVDESAEHAEAQKGKTYIVVHLVSNRTLPRCMNDHTNRLLVLLDEHGRIWVTIPLTFMGVADPDKGAKAYDAIFGLPAPLNPKLQFWYKADVHDNCGVWETAANITADWVSGWLGREMHIVEEGTPPPTNMVPVKLQDTPVKIKGIDVLDPGPSP